MSVEEQFSQEFERLPLRDIVVGMQEFLILDKHFVEVRLQEVGRDHLVAR
jgi:hypothetical protein